LFLVSYMVQSPTSSTLSDLQTLQSAITQDIATLEANQGTTPDTTPVIPQQNVPQVTQGVPQQTQATSATITLDPNSPSGSVQAVNGQSLKVPLLTEDITSNVADTFTDSNTVVSFTGLQPTKVYLYVNGKLADYIPNNSESLGNGQAVFDENNVPEASLVNGTTGTLSISADYTGVTSTSTVSASIDTTKAQVYESLPKNIDGNNVSVTGGVIQGNQITINP